jgi:hypothetical protein
MTQERLVSRSELVRRLAGAKKTMVYDQCARGGKLHAAMVGQKVDLNHKNARLFCAEFGYQEPDATEIRKAAVAHARAKVASEPAYDLRDYAADTIAPDELDGDDKSSTQFMDMSLREIVKTYGRQAQFKEYVNAYKVLITTQAAEEKMSRDRGEYAHWSHIERLAMHIDGLHKMLLTDTAKNITDTAKTLAAAGSTDLEIRAAITKALEQTIKMAKIQSVRIIKNAKS